MEAVNAAKTSVNLYQSTRRNNPEDSHLQAHSLSPFQEVSAFYGTSRSITMFRTSCPVLSQVDQSDTHIYLFPEMNAVL
jgi:hypothetical protein